MIESSRTVHVVRAINEQRGCPHTMGAADEMGTAPVDQMTADARKAEYYFLLDGVLQSVVGRVRDFRDRFLYGLVQYDSDGEIVSGMNAMRSRIAPHLAKRDFQGATYWAHDAVHRTVDVATEQWLRATDTTSAEYTRINSLVDAERQEAYGGVAVQKRVSSAANQAVNISGSFQRMTDSLFVAAEGRPITETEMLAAHEANLRTAMPLTRFHLHETRPIREVLGAFSMPDSDLTVYTEEEFFTYEAGALHLAGNGLVEAMAAYGGQFPDGRIGCPGAKYVPEIWDWAGQVSAEFAMPVLGSEGY